jgi:hypothetical protein
MGETGCRAGKGEGEVSQGGHSIRTCQIRYSRSSPHFEYTIGNTPLRLGLSVDVQESTEVALTLESTDEALALESTDDALARAVCCSISLRK